MARRAANPGFSRHQLQTLDEEHAVEVRLVHRFEGPAIDQLPAHVVVVAQEILRETALGNLTAEEVEPDVGRHGNETVVDACIAQRPGQEHDERNHEDGAAHPQRPAPTHVHHPQGCRHEEQGSEERGQHVADDPVPHAGTDGVGKAPAAPRVEEEPHRPGRREDLKRR